MAAVAVEAVLIGPVEHRVLGLNRGLFADHRIVVLIPEAGPLGRQILNSGVLRRFHKLYRNLFILIYLKVGHLNRLIALPCDRVGVGHARHQLIYAVLRIYGAVIHLIFHEYHRVVRRYLEGYFGQLSLDDVKPVGGGLGCAIFMAHLKLQDLLLRVHIQGHGQIGDIAVLSALNRRVIAAVAVIFTVLVHEVSVDGHGLEARHHVHIVIRNIPVKGQGIALLIGQRQIAGHGAERQRLQVKGTPDGHLIILIVGDAVLLPVGLHGNGIAVAAGHQHTAQHRRHLRSADLDQAGPLGIHAVIIPVGRLLLPDGLYRIAVDGRRLHEDSGVGVRYGVLVRMLPRRKALIRRELFSGPVGGRIVHGKGRHRVCGLRRRHCDSHLAAALVRNRKCGFGKIQVFFGGHVGILPIRDQTVYAVHRPDFLAALCVDLYVHAGSRLHGDIHGADSLNLKGIGFGLAVGVGHLHGNGVVPLCQRDFSICAFCLSVGYPDGISLCAIARRLHGQLRG